MADETIASSVRVDGSIVYRTKRQFVEGNLDKVLNEEPRPGASRKLPGKEEALLVATACSSPPEGRAPPDDRVAGRGDGAVDRSRRPLARDGTSAPRSEEHTSELQSLMRISYAVFCLQK